MPRKISQPGLLAASSSFCLGGLTLTAIAPVALFGSVLVPGHGLALACTALAFWLVARGGGGVSISNALLAGVVMLVGVLAHQSAIWSPVIVLGWLLVRDRVPSFFSLVAMLTLPAAYMVLCSPWAAAPSLILIPPLLP